MRKETCLKYFQAHKGAVLCVAISPDGKMLASGGEDGNAILWDFESGEQLKELAKLPQAILSLCFHPSESQIAIGSEKEISVWSIQEAKPLYSIDYPYWANALMWDSEGIYLAYGGYDNSVFLWNTKEQKKTMSLYGHEQEITCLSFNPEKTRIASGSNDHTIKIWDIQEGKCLCSLNEHSMGITGISFNKEGNKLASCSLDGTIRIWNVQSGICMYCLQHDRDWLTDCSFLSNSQKLVSSSGMDMAIAEGENSIALWDMESARCVEKFYNHDFPITQICTSRNGNQMASCDLGGKIALWDFSCYMEEENQNKASLSPDVLPCVLTIDDDEWIQRLIKSALKKDYRIITAANGKEGFLQAQKEKPDLIVLDIMMPEMDGWELIKKLRSEPEFLLTPIIFLTALDSPEDRVRGLKLGASDYMSKPFNSQELAARVQKLISFKRQIEKSVEQKKLTLPSSRKSALSGKLEHISLVSILKVIETEKQTGVLVCSEEKITQKIYFRSGHIVLAGEENAKAIEEMVLYFSQQRKGLFDFWLAPVEEGKELVTISSLLYRKL